MRVLIEAKPWADEVEIAFVERLGKYVSWADGIGDDGRLTWKRSDEGTDTAKPLLTLHRDVLTDLAKALGAYVPESDATVAALKDTQVVRDRLLTLVEKQSERS